MQCHCIVELDPMEGTIEIISTRKGFLDCVSYYVTILVSEYTFPAAAPNTSAGSREDLAYFVLTEQTFAAYIRDSAVVRRFGVYR